MKNYIITVLVKTLLIWPVQAQNYAISFRGTGASEMVDSVSVVNITKGTSFTFAGNDILTLQPDFPTVTNSHDIDLPGSLFIYPNPSDYSAYLEFTPACTGESIISVSDLSGRFIFSESFELDQSAQRFILSGVRNGIYFINVIGCNYRHSGKLISLNPYFENIKLQQIQPAYYSKEYETKQLSLAAIGEKKILNYNKRSQANPVFAYNEGDRLQFTGYSGVYSTIVMGEPVTDTTITFEFVTCTDGDDNNYMVVKIGTQTWMAENLRTTSFNTGEKIPNITDEDLWLTATTPAYRFLNNQSEYIKSNGAIYNWLAVYSWNLCPLGWHLPDSSEFSVLKVNLETNGYGSGGIGNDIAEFMKVDPEFTSDPVNWWVPAGLRNNSYRENKSTKQNGCYIKCIEDTGPRDTIWLRTRLYKARVEAEGGFVVNSHRVKSDLIKIHSLNELSSLKLALSCEGGVKTVQVNGRRAVSKVYDFSGHNLDAVQTTAANMPGFYGDFSFLLQAGIDFKDDEAEGIKTLVHQSLLNGNFTAFYVLYEKDIDIEYIHSGNINNGKTAILSRCSTYGTGPSMYRQAPSELFRGSADSLIVNDCRLLTFDPDHIYLNGSEVTYYSGKKDSVPMIDLTTIGGRPGVPTYNSGMTLAAIFVFDKVLDSLTRTEFETYLKSQYLNADYSKSDIQEVPQYEQLPYKELCRKGSKILGYNYTTHKIIYSETSGTSWTELTNPDVTVHVGYIFSNGNIFICTSSKAYKSTDKLASLIEIKPLDENGNAFTSIAYFTFSPFHDISSQIIDENNEIIAWGNYGGGVANVYASLNGDDCRIIYRFGDGYTYKAVHVHCVTYCATANKWYITTGDLPSRHEIHFIEAVYNGSWSFTHLLEGTNTNQTKLTGLRSVGKELYWSADVTSGTENRGLWKSTLDNFGLIGNHVRELGLPFELCDFIVEEDRIIFGFYHPNNRSGIVRNWEIFTYNRRTYEIKRYYMKNITPARPNIGYFLGRMRKNGAEYFIDIFSNSRYQSNTIKFVL